MPNIPALSLLLGEPPKTPAKQTGLVSGSRQTSEPVLAKTVQLNPDAVKTSGSRPSQPLQQELKSVQQQLTAAPPTLTDKELRRLLNGPNTLNKMQSLIQRDPGLAEAFKGQGGAQVLKLIQTASQRTLSKEEVKVIQRYLTSQGHASIGYRGHATGIDGDYGRLTHGALVQMLTQAVSATPASAKPSAEQPKVETPAVQSNPALKPTPVVAVPTAPESETTGESPESIQTPELLTRLQQPGQSLQQMASLIQALPDSERDKLTHLGKDSNNLGSLLAEAANRPLNKTENIALQTLLVAAGEKLSYPGHPTGIDGNLGRRSQQALVKVIGKLLTGEALSLAQPMPRYDKMLSDKLLDMTLAVGFDEGTYQYMGANTFEEKKLVKELESRGFVHDDARARALIQASGKEVHGDYAALYVKENIDSQDGQPVHAVVRVIESGDGSHGAANRQAAIEGMNQSDVFAYGGHGRYGNGPDFDRNFTVTVDWSGVANAPASGTVVYKDYEQLKTMLGTSDSEAISRLQELEKAGKLKVEAVNDGNIRMNEKPLHSSEFGSQLTHRAVQQLPNTLAQEIKGEQYKLWLFEACRTRDFVAPIRHQSQSSPALDAQHLDLLTTEQVMYWENTGASMLALLDGVLAKDTAPALLGRLKAVNPQQAAEGPTHSFHGFEDNPRK